MRKLLNDERGSLAVEMALLLVLLVIISLIMFVIIPGRIDIVSSSEHSQEFKMIVSILENL